MSNTTQPSKSYGGCSTFAWQRIRRHTTEEVMKIGCEVLLHPPYSPDQALSDFHLFGMLKESHGGIHYRSSSILASLTNISSHEVSSEDEEAVCQFLRNSTVLTTFKLNKQILIIKTTTIENIYNFSFWNLRFA